MSSSEQALRPQCQLLSHPIGLKLGYLAVNIISSERLLYLDQRLLGLRLSINAQGPSQRGSGCWPSYTESTVVVRCKAMIWSDTIAVLKGCHMFHAQRLNRWETPLAQPAFVHHTNSAGKWVPQFRRGRKEVLSDGGIILLRSPVRLECPSVAPNPTQLFLTNL